MTFVKNKQPMIYQNHPRQAEQVIDPQQVQALIQELGRVVNNQGDGLRQAISKLGEILFKVSKMDEQLQQQRVAIRTQKDRLNMFFKSMSELGVIDQDIFNLTFSMCEVKSLPITSDGKVNAAVSLTRYNHTKDLPRPNLET